MADLLMECDVTLLVTFMLLDGESVKSGKYLPKDDFWKR